MARRSALAAALACLLCALLTGGAIPVQTAAAAIGAEAAAPGSASAAAAAAAAPSTGGPWRSASASPFVASAASPVHGVSEVPVRGDHPSAFPSMKIVPRPDAEVAAERAADAELYRRLHAAHVQAQAAGTAADPAIAAELDPSTADFLERASETLSTVMGRDAEKVFQYKALLSRANNALRARHYDKAATLFKEASKMYFDAVAAPYAKIGTSRALGRTMEERLERQLERERGDAGTGEAAGANSAAQQFRAKELQNHPAVHTAFLEYTRALQQHRPRRRDARQKPHR